jgi:hypothetical protein
MMRRTSARRQFGSAAPGELRLGRLTPGCAAISGCGEGAWSPHNLIEEPFHRCNHLTRTAADAASSPGTNSP